MLASIVTWVKSNIVVSIVIGTVVVGGAVATPFIINYYQEEQPKQEEQLKQEEKDNSDKDSEQPITCEDGLVGTESNTCINPNEYYNLNDNLDYRKSYTTYRILPEKCFKYINGKPTKVEYPNDKICIATSSGVISVPITNSVIEDLSTWSYLRVISDVIKPGETTSGRVSNKMDLIVIDIIITIGNEHISACYENNCKFELLDKLLDKHRLSQTGFVAGDFIFLDVDKNPMSIGILNEKICEDYNLQCERW